MARWDSCNIVQAGADANRVWQFNKNFTLNRELKTPVGELLPAGLVGKRRLRGQALVLASLERLTRANGQVETVPVACRIDTPIEVDYYQHGGILPYVLRQLASTQGAAPEAAEKG